MENNTKRIVEILKVLSHEKRLLILSNLMEGFMTVGELAAKIGNIGMSALSQHLALLKAHRILESEKRGQNVIYYIRDHRIESVLHILQKEYGNEDQ